MSDDAVKKFIQELPKAELHVHLEGTMEPEQLMFFAQRNGIEVPYHSIEDARRAYHFSDFESFYDAYVQATKVLKTEQDFYDLAFAYLKKAAEQGVVHAEIFFDLQTYIPRRIAPDTIINGLHRAVTDAHEAFGISGGLIMCFLRHLTQEDALRTLELSLPFKDKIMGVGLACQEEGNPPSKFEKAFQEARRYGYHIVAHEGESIATGLQEAVELIKVERLDHGIHILQEPELLQKLIEERIPLTVCPLSNVAVKSVDDIKNHPLKKMFEAGLFVTINSDDPAFFGGYIAENYYAAYKEIGLSLDDLVTCAYNSIEASFADQALKQKYFDQLNDFIATFKKDVH
ncbi:adenosine deaminase [Candidatus Dependentiae bacterium]|nr:adenosine deaminase [Candidatus Dependentiae bacterium]MCC7414909.1 adenosine deaminase [Campylobacterota bacterium]